MDHLSIEEVTAVFAEQLTQPGAFQIRGNRDKRNKFYYSLLNTPALVDQYAGAQALALDMFSTIQLIEQCFDETLSSLPKCAISAFPKDVQFWSHVERASRELKQLDNAAKKVMSEFEAKAKANLPFSIPEMIMAELPDGTVVNIDATYSNIISTLSLTLKMLSFEQKLLSKGKLVAPQKATITDEHVFKAGSIQLYAHTWDALEDIANRTLFFGGAITNIENAGISRDTLPDNFLSKFPSPLIFHRDPSDIEIYDFLANRRLHSWAVQNSNQLLQGTQLAKLVMVKGAAVPTLQSGRFVSEEEGITLARLAEILSFDVFQIKIGITD
ncbi:hypothetical protein ACSZMR_01750 [Aeromonas veronii]